MHIGGVGGIYIIIKRVPIIETRGVQETRRGERGGFANVLLFVALASYRMMRRTDLKTACDTEFCLLLFVFFERREQAKSPGGRAATSYT